MNESNPIINLQTEKRKYEPKTYYPVKVCCVVWDLSDSNGDTQIKMIKDHTHKSNAHFMTRVYDSSKYTDDRYQITRLPAFHVYIKGAYNRTFYSNTRPLQHVDECIELYIRRCETTNLRKKRWLMLYESFLAWIKRMRHTETRMERYEREKEKVIETPRFENIKLNSVGLSEWN